MNHYHDTTHGEYCGIHGYFTGILCQGVCGTIIPYPPVITGERGYYCEQCWRKRYSQDIPTRAERQEALAAMERWPYRMPDSPREAPTYYEATEEERAWAREEIARQKTQVGL